MTNDQPASATFTLPALPYDKAALEPHISAKTFEFHHGKHHKAYVDNLNKAVMGTPLADMDLSKIITSTYGKPDQTGIYNNAAQAWNHTFYWNSMTPHGGGPSRAGRVARAIASSFGSYEEFVHRFKALSSSLFGSGWIWLYRPDETDRIELAALSNASNPLTTGGVPILVADLWEHAYYLDHQNQSARYIHLFLEHLVHWDFVEQTLTESRGLAARIAQP